MSSHPVVERFELLYRRLVLAEVIRGASYGALAGIAFGVGIGIPTGIGIGIASGAAFAALRCPRRAAAARRFDLQLGLEDRLITTLEVAAHTDPMARLVVDDTWQRISEIAPSSIVPMRALAAGARLAVGLVVVAVMAVPGPLGRLRTSTPRTSMPADTSAPPAQSEDAAGARGGSAASAGGHAVRASDARPGAASSMTVTTANDTARESTVAPGGSGFLAPGNTAGEAGGSARDAGSGVEDRITSGAGAAATTQEALEPRSASGSSSGGTSEAPGDSHVGIEPAATANHPLVQRAEAALSRTPVPPGLRRYVMNYFLSITR